jgi:hypothetical protein
MSPFFEIGQIVTFLYFFFFFVIFPGLGLVEKFIYDLFLNFEDILMQKKDANKYKYFFYCKNVISKIW